MHSAAISHYTLSPSIIRTNGKFHRKPNHHLYIRTLPDTQQQQQKQTSFALKASNSSYSSITEIIDLYELLGVDSSCNQASIKAAYRALQKRCHPDIAGPAGHDMAIVLNEAYTVLSDPNLRLAYDKEQEKVEDLRGYTGKPIYSVWVGSENEKRSVFVDEVKCVGCLKCALLAEKTFAVESTYGRARVVAQWADQEDKIQAAIDACPVDCISVVPRSDLAALEFLMSKKERGRVRIGAGNTVGLRASNVFDDLQKFQARYNMSKSMFKEPNIQKKSWASAIYGIRSVSNWFYWKAPVPNSAEPYSNQKHLTCFKGNHNHTTPDPDLERLKKVVSESREYKYKKQPLNLLSNHDEYWDPLNQALPVIKDTVPKPSPTIKVPKVLDKDLSSSSEKQKRKRKVPLFLRVFPMGLAATATAIISWLQQGEERVGGVGGSGLEGHIGGSLVKEIVNSSWLQVFLAGVTWYLIGLYVVQVVWAIQVNVEKYEQK